MALSTPATKVLDKFKIAYALQTYNYDPNAARVGLQAAEAIGVPPARVFKTLMTYVDGKAVCVLAPSDKEVSMKKLAAASGGKKAAMMPVPDAEKFTAYKVGGISPLGQKKSAPAILDESAFNFEEIYINGGQRGLQILIAPGVLKDVLKAAVSSVTL